MIYEFPITVLTTDTEASPAEEDIKLTNGVVHRVEIEFPAGCVGLVHIAIYHMGHQVWPSNPEGSFASEDYVVAFDDYYPLLGPPYLFKILGWTDETTYDHTIKVRFGLLPENVARGMFGISGAAQQQYSSGDLLAALGGV